jgi:hypothetical protein
VVRRDIRDAGIEEAVALETVWARARGRPASRAPRAVLARAPGCSIRARPGRRVVVGLVTRR